MKKRLSAMVLAFVVALSMIPGVFAAGHTVDIENGKGTITVKPTNTKNGKIVEGLDITLYKVGEPRVENHNLYFDLQVESDIDLNGGAITADQIEALAKGLSDAEKESLFAGMETSTEAGAFFEGMDVGVYLVVKTSKDRYSFDPFLIYLPQTETDEETETSYWEFDVEAEPKTTYKSNPTPDKSLTVKKVWADNNDEKGLRPDAIEVQLLKDGQAYGNPVVLDKSVKWSYTWEDLDRDSEWSVVELEVEGYTSSVKKSGSTVTITNTLKDEPPVEIPDDPTPKDPGEEIEDPDVPLGDLPQTGLLQWPIPLMALAGIVVFFAGFIANRKARQADED